jgi:hypothetical protein
VYPQKGALEGTTGETYEDTSGWIPQERAPKATTRQANEGKSGTCLGVPRKEPTRQTYVNISQKLLH